MKGPEARKNNRQNKIEYHHRQRIRENTPRTTKKDMPYIFLEKREDQRGSQILSLQKVFVATGEVIRMALETGQVQATHPAVRWRGA